ncbi:ABC transporter substrate-binding protein (plasmid) [Halobaculum sp. CBA1158]|uniref:substrate-binding domain-containing protein n=1 Tax=Halobaculum sp. CBA1158 TaxID=2904243 RepID=UPI001F40A6DD|nr:ABC transporter substrate-binding protein [Halobaculum sp. CBA1158]UIP01504.1 ABC transporter substrate-binding protein [Halobaculum sp. CBA1158]
MTRINRRAFLKASGGTATLGVLAGCSGNGGNGGDDGGDNGGGSSDPITIGALEPVSGPFAAWATPHRDGLQFAVEEINANGGVLDGRDLEVSVTDTGADAGQADSSFRRLVEQDGAVATTGAVSSDVGIRVSQTAEELQVPHLLHMSGADDVITQETRHVFRVGLNPASTYIQAQASAFAEADYSNVGAIIGDYAWGRSAETAINEYFDVDVNIQVAPVGASDFTSYLRQFSDDLEMLISSGHPPGGVSIANQAYEVGLNPDVITGSSAPPQLLTGALSEEAIENYVHIHNSNPYEEAFTEVGSAFAEEYDMQFNTHTAYGYVTAYILAAGIEEAGSTEPTEIANGIRNTSVDTLFAEPIQWNEYGELDQQVVLFSNLLLEAPSYDSNGNHSYEELYRSEPVPARVPGE